MNTYIIVLKNGDRFKIKADDFERNAERIRFQDLTEERAVAIFMNNSIAGFFLEQYEV